MGINIISEVFDEGEKIPERHTCESINISPPLQWNTLPEHTVSFAILCEDPDALQGAFTHWIIFNIPSNVQKLPSAIVKDDKLTNGSVQGVNDFGYAGYGGPCPPEGEEHRYYFRIYALDKTLNLNPPVKRENFLKALNENILDEGKLMGRYGR